MTNLLVGFVTGIVAVLVPGVVFVARVLTHATRKLEQANSKHLEAQRLLANAQTLKADEESSAALAFYTWAVEQKFMLACCDIARLEREAQRATCAAAVVGARRRRRCGDRARASEVDRMSEFAGQNRVVLASADRVSTHTHRLDVVEYSFPDGSTERYVEVHESWPDGMRMDRRVALTDAVHALLNLGEDELFAIGNRSPHHRTEASR